jgi:hypothetical protein
MTSPRLPQGERFEYDIDDQDIIQNVSRNWWSFANNNDGYNLKLEAVVGHLLWDFISGAEARHYYGLLFQKVRRDRCSISLPFRCDAPDCRRYMQLSIHPGESDSLQFVSELMREVPRPPVALLDQCLMRGKDFVTLCAWCKRVHCECDQWLEAEAAMEQLNLQDQSTLPNIRNGLCGTCRFSLENLLQS